MFDEWLSQQSHYNANQRVTFRQVLKHKLEAMWAEKFWRKDVQDLAKAMTPRAVMHFMVQEGLHRSFHSLSEEWRALFDFLQVKTQPMLSPALRSSLLDPHNDLEWSGTLEELLGEVSTTRQAPLTSVTELMMYVKSRDAQLESVVKELHMGAANYMSLLQDLRKRYQT